MAIRYPRPTDDVFDSRDVIEAVEVGGTPYHDALVKLNDDCKDWVEDWEYGATLIRDSYFTEYAQDLASDIGAIAHDAHWPNNHIDWQAAAEELKQDYTEVDFDGDTYYVR